MWKLKMHWQILIALFFGVLLGIFTPGLVPYFGWMGEVFLNGLKMMIVPLILFSIINGMVNMGTGKNLGKLGFKTLLYYLSTSFLAITTGLLLVNLVRPGVGAKLDIIKEAELLGATKIPFVDTLLNIVPQNIFIAMAENQVLSIIFFGLLVGYFLPRIGNPHSKILINGVNALFELTMKITMFIIQFAPLGILGLVAKTVAEQNDIIGVAQGLGGYFVTVVAALLIHAVIILPLLLWFVAKVNPVQHFKAMSTALLTAFSTSSSSATLPLTMEAIEHKAGVSNKITSFTLPLGATVNMDGTALYECVAVIFIAQFYGMDLSLSQQALILFTALLASIGAAGIPMAGLIMMSVILTAVDLPLAGIGLILAVDRPLDMLRTTVNVWSDSCGAVIIAKSEKENMAY